MPKKEEILQDKYTAEEKMRKAINEAKGVLE